MSYDMRGKRVYLSGPMTALPDNNAPAFAEVAERCRAAGAVQVFNPCTAWGHSNRPRHWYMLHDLHRLTEVDGDRPWFDAIVMLDGWTHSQGARAEYYMAQECGIAQVNAREVGR